MMSHFTFYMKRLGKNEIGDPSRTCWCSGNERMNLKLPLKESIRNGLSRGHSMSHSLLSTSKRRCGDQANHEHWAFVKTVACIGLSCFFWKPIFFNQSKSPMCVLQFTGFGLSTYRGWSFVVGASSTSTSLPWRGKPCLSGKKTCGIR